MVYELTIRLRKSDVYRIFNVTLNGKTLPHPNLDYYFGEIKPFDCSVGDTIKLVVAIKKKNEFRQDPMYFTVAQLKIQNLIKNYVFPVPGQKINLLTYPGNTLNFAWKFTNFNQKTQLTILSPFGAVFDEYASGENCEVPKNCLEHNQTYRIYHGACWGPKQEFILAKEASKDSKISFGHRYVLSFKTH